MLPKKDRITKESLFENRGGTNQSKISSKEKEKSAKQILAKLNLTVSK